MNTVQQIRTSLAPQLDAVNSLIGSSLRSSNELMNRIIASYLTHKGKQLRPLLVLLTGKLTGGINDRTIAGAAAIEILHNASLIHDDVIDTSAVRHGHPTINAVWDNHIAVLVGDFFVSTSLRLAMRTESSPVIGTIASLGRLLSEGEMDQLSAARFHTLTEESYFNVIRHKTASLFVSCVEMGCYCSGITSGPVLDALREYARIFGLCFQIKDDIFDYFSDSRLGKPTGNDLREGKVTLPLIHALTASAHPQREEMLALVEQDSLTDSHISRLIEFAKEAGGIEYAEATLRSLRDSATAALAPLGDDAAPLTALLEYVISRDN